MSPIESLSCQHDNINYSCYLHLCCLDGCFPTVHITLTITFSSIFALLASCFYWITLVCFVYCSLPKSLSIKDIAYKQAWVKNTFGLFKLFIISYLFTILLHFCCRHDECEKLFGFVSHIKSLSLSYKA